MESKVSLGFSDEMRIAGLECQIILTTEATAGKATKQQHNENDLDNWGNGRQGDEAAAQWEDFVFFTKH